MNPGQEWCMLTKARLRIKQSQHFVPLDLDGCHQKCLKFDIVRTRARSAKYLS